LKKVLIISYYWPPGSGPGVQRFLKFSKYLKMFGWEPIILTVEKGSYPSIDFSLLNDIPKDMKIFKTKTFEPFRLYNMLRGKKGKSTTVGMLGMHRQGWIQKLALYIRANYFIPDARKGWRKYALKKARKIINNEGIDAIISTGPPHSTHLIGLDLKKQFNLPWIVDMRDPWTTIFYNKYFPRNEAAKLKDKKLEDLVIKNADGVVVVSDGLKQEFLNRNKNISTIYNGFDLSDFNFSIPKENKRFIISYIGNFKPNQNVVTLWEVLSEIKNEITEFSSDLELFLTGNIDSSVVNSLHKNRLEENLNLSSFVSHKEAIERMITSDLLLFIIPKSKRNKLIITGKLFEYIASRNKILGIGPVDGDASKILQDANRVPLFDYNDKKNIKSQVLDAYNNWKNKQNQSFDFGDIKKYDRKFLTQQLVNKLNNLIDED